MMSQVCDVTGLCVWRSLVHDAELLLLPVLGESGDNHLQESVEGHTG